MPDEIVNLIEELVSELSPIANELNEDVERLADIAEGIDTDLDREELFAEITEQLNKACSVLKKLKEAFSKVNNNGESFVDMIKNHYGSGSIGIIEGEFQTILNAESERLKQIGLNEVVIDLVIQQMKTNEIKLRIEHEIT